MQNICQMLFKLQKFDQVILTQLCQNIVGARFLRRDTYA